MSKSVPVAGCIRVSVRYASCRTRTSGVKEGAEKEEMRKCVVASAAAKN